MLQTTGPKPVVAVTISRPDSSRARRPEIGAVKVIARDQVTVVELDDDVAVRLTDRPARLCRH